MSRQDKLSPEPMNVYTWMLLASIFFMGISIMIIRTHLKEAYELEGMPKIMGFGDGMRQVESK